MPFFTVSFVGQHPVASGLIRIEAADRNAAALKLGKIIPISKIRGVWMSSEQGHPGATSKIANSKMPAGSGTRQETLFL
jgi:hypothetical protein